MARTNILVLEHQPLFMGALSTALRSAFASEVRAQLLADGLQELAAHKFKPDIVTIDPCVAGRFEDGLIGMAKDCWPAARVVVVTDCNAEDVIVSALAGGAHAFLLKSEPIETICLAIELVCRGPLAFSLPAAVVLATANVSAKHRLSVVMPKVRGLTPREVEVLDLIARGNIDPVIAGVLGISVRTVQRHVSNILNKLDCRTRSEAVANMLGSAPPLSRVR